MTTSRKSSLKFDKCIKLDVDMCAYDVLVLLAQPFAIELSTFNPQEVDYNDCLSKHIHFLALFALESLHWQN